MLAARQGLASRWGIVESAGGWSNAGKSWMRRNEQRSLAEGFPVADVQSWVALAAKAAGGMGLERLVTRTDDGILVAPLYSPVLGNSCPDRAPSGGWPQHWEIVQPHRHPDPKEAANQAREDLEGGTTAVVLRLDRALARGGGRPDGVVMYDRLALEQLLALLPGDAGSIRLEAGDQAIERLSDLMALVGRGSGPLGARACRILGDPVSVALEGACSDPREGLHACIQALGRSTFLDIVADGRPWHEAGASEALEIAAALASAVLWLRHGEAAGFPLERLLDRLELVLAVDTDLFLSLAKLRAARLVFERILKAAHLGHVAGSIRIRAETGTRMLSRLDPWVNVLRTTVAALAAVAGGADAVTVLPFDRPLGEASPLARRIARNIPLILREEAGAGRVRDPAAGSWYVAHLTRSLAETAWAKLQAIEAAGGLLGALESGSLQAEAEKMGRARAERVADGVDALVGVSVYPNLDERASTEVGVDVKPALAAAQVVHAARLRTGSAPPFPPLRQVRFAEPFEILRARAEAARSQHGQRPSVLVLGLGRQSELYELFTRVENLLAAGGLAAMRMSVREPVEAAEVVRRQAGPVVIACVGAGSARRASELVNAIRSAGVDRPWLAGHAEPWPSEAGAITPEVDLLAFLEDVHAKLGTPRIVSGDQP